MAQKLTPNKNKTLLNIIYAGLLTGTLDALAALIINYKINPTIVFKFIASGVYGKAAFAGGSEMIAAGLVFHYLIAFAFSIAFYLLYTFFYEGLRNKYLVAFIYGFAAWIIMNMVVIPFSKIGKGHIKIGAILLGMAVLIICVGLPIVLIADRQYRKGKAQVG